MSNKYLDQMKPDATNMLNKYTLDQLPNVDIIMLTVRPSLIGRIVSNINGQKLKPSKVIIIMQGYNEQQAKTLQVSIKNCEEVILIHNNDTTVKLGTRNNTAFNLTTSPYVAIMDDDDVYYPNYLHSQLSYLKDHGKPTIISKINPIGRDESNGKIGFLRKNLVGGNNQVGAGGSFVIHREVLELVGGFEEVQVGYDSKLMHAAYKAGYTLIPADPFNFIVTRGRSEGNTWKLPRNNGIVFNDIQLSEVEL